MKIKLLIATGDDDYAEFLSTLLSEKYADGFDVHVRSSKDQLLGLSASNKYDVALIEPGFQTAINPGQINLSLLLVSELDDVIEDEKDMVKISKYQRISSIVGKIWENYAVIDSGKNTFGTRKAHITAIWSPCGGVGKTTVALACAANKVSGGKQTVYLNLEDFSSTSTYFASTGRSISKVFEKLDSNINMLLAGIRSQDSSSGIWYFDEPENYDDMNILTSSDIEILVEACSTEMDELVIDLSNNCDERIQNIFELSDTILLVCDPSATAQEKLKQFVVQHNIFGKVQHKIILVNNKGAKVMERKISRVSQLPFVESHDPVSVYKTLSSGNFDW